MSNERQALTEDSIGYLQGLTNEALLERHAYYYEKMERARRERTSEEWKYTEYFRMTQAIILSRMIPNDEVDLWHRAKSEL